ncbi:MAG: Rpn family recombination-promoting nuclease/putative transposase, partial [Treponema sp.]|nr:Rpn family recombination-promoting nuclease/putative transposase [Treponema sp.]
MGANSRYKDSVFSLLFARPDVLRELYSAIAGIPLDPDIPIEINTLQDAVFKGKINDISFSIGTRLVVLIEHQSTINPNMPVRLLMYIARVYEKLLKKRNIYSSKRIRFPCPEFIVLYNGIAPYPDRQTLRLSESFEDTAAVGIPAGSPVLELLVKVYNINQGHNEAIVKKSETLAGYSAFIAKIREYGQSMSLEEAMKAAVGYCIRHDILRAFLEENASEVTNMLLNEW